MKNHRSVSEYQPSKPLGDIGAFEVDGEIRPIVRDHPPCQALAPRIEVDPLAHEQTK